MSSGRVIYNTKSALKLTDQFKQKLKKITTENFLNSSTKRSAYKISVEIPVSLNDKQQTAGYYFLSVLCIYFLACSILDICNMEGIFCTV